MNLDTTKGFFGAVLFLALLGLGLIWYSYPDENELALLFFKDGRLASAYPLYEDLYERGDHSWRIVIPLTEINLGYGDTHKAISLLEQLVKDEPDEESSRRRLGELYLYANRPYDYYQNLSVLVSKYHHENDIRELIGYYQDQGDIEKVEVAYQEILDLGIVEEDDLEQLAFLQAQEGQTEKALDTLSLLPDHLIEHIETVILEDSLLLRAGQKERAYELASSFLRRKHHISMALRLAELFDYHQETLLAFDLLEPFKDHLDMSPVLLRSYANYAEKLGRIDEVLALLQNQFDQGRLSNELLATYLNLLIDKKDEGRLRILVEKTNINALDDVTIIDLLDFGFDSGSSRGDFFNLVKGKISANRLKSSPRLTLVFIAFDGTPEAFETKLASYTLKVPFRLELAQDLFRLGHPDMGKIAFDSITNLEGLSADEITRFAIIASDLHEAQAPLVLLDHVSSPALVKTGKMILGVALGQNEAAIAALIATPPMEIDLLEEIVRIALDNKNVEVALKGALLWDSLESGIPSQTALAAAYFLNHQDKEALTLYRWLIRETPDPTDLYEPYLLVLRSSGSKGKFNQVLKESVENPLIPLEVKDGWASAFEERGDKQVAKAIYRYLIRQDPSKIEWVDSFLDLTGEHPTRRQLKAIVRAASRAPMTTKSLYLDYLNGVKDYTDVIYLIAPGELSEDPIRMAYFEALLGVCQYETFRCAASEILFFWDRDKLEAVGALAFDHSVFDISLEIGRIIEDVKMEAYSAYELGAYTEAYFGLLELYENGDPDFKIPYFIGEILWQWECKCEAYGYFAVAKQRIDWLLAITQEKEEIIEATSAYAAIIYIEQNEIGALALFDDLLHAYPDNLDIVADYADHLTASQYFGTERELFDAYISSPFSQAECFCGEQGIGLTRVYIERVKYLRSVGRMSEAFCLLQELICFQDKFPEPSNLWVSLAETDELATYFRQGNAAYLLARDFNPASELIPEDQWEAYQDYRSFLDATGELRHTTPHQTEHLYTANLFKRFGLPYFLDLTFEMDHYSANDVLNAITGASANVRGYRYRTSVLGGYDCYSGDRFIGGFYAARQIFGLKGEYIRKDVYGESFLDLQYHYPTWEIMEAVVERGLYDQIKIGRTHYFTRHFRFEGWTAYRFWSIAHISEVCNSWATYWDMIYTFDDPFFQRYLGDGGFLDIIYNLDAEYIFDRKIGVDADGTPFQRIPLITQETHSLSLLASKVFSSRFRAEGFVGYSYNRHGIGAPQAGLKLVLGKKNCWEVTLDVSLEASTTVNGGTVDRFLMGAHVLF